MSDPSINSRTSSLADADMEIDTDIKAESDNKSPIKSEEGNSKGEKENIGTGHKTSNNSDNNDGPDKNHDNTTTEVKDDVTKIEANGDHNKESDNNAIKIEQDHDVEMKDVVPATNGTPTHEKIKEAQKVERDEKAKDVYKPQETQKSDEIDIQIDDSNINDIEIKDAENVKEVTEDLETPEIDETFKTSEINNIEIKTETANGNIVSTPPQPNSEPPAKPISKPNPNCNPTFDLEALNEITHLRYTPLKTGYCYDVRMRYHAKIVTSNFDYVDPHPEDPRRIYRVYKSLAESGIIIDPKLEGLDDVGSLMEKIPVRFATDDELLLVHTQQHLDSIKSTTTMSREKLIRETEKGDSVYFNNDTYASALLSCGGTIEVTKAVVEGRVKNGFAIVRPPGHHAEPGNPAGFCVYSNVAVAAKTMLRDYPDKIRKILILDWDVHHGNGTQRAFYNDPRVLYMSLHRYEGVKFYPGTDYAASFRCGEGAGTGFTVNIPWTGTDMGDADYIYAMTRVIMPISIEFDPDLVLISSGFDAAEGDPIGGYHLTPNAYGYLTHMMKTLANGNLVVVMEGGYNLD